MAKDLSRHMPQLNESLLVASDERTQYKDSFSAVVEREAKKSNADFSIVLESSCVDVNAPKCPWYG